MCQHDGPSCFVLCRPIPSLSLSNFTYPFRIKNGNTSRRSPGVYHSHHQHVQSPCMQYSSPKENGPSENDKEKPNNNTDFNNSNNVEGNSMEFTLYSRRQQDQRNSPDSRSPIALLPFGVREMFLPGMTKTLHLYEARWLRMFEEVLATPSRKFAHVIVAPERQAMAAHAVLVEIVEWQKLDLGVEVKIAGTGRVKVGRLVGGKPFMRGLYEPLTDDYERSQSLNHEELCRLEARIWSSIKSIIDLAVKADTDPIVARDTSERKAPPANDLNSAEEDTPKSASDIDIQGDDRKAIYEDEIKMAYKRAGNITGEDTSVIKRLEALSFAAFMVTNVSLNTKQKALECKDTVKRAELVSKYLENTRKQLAAKVALKNAFVKEP